MHVTDISVVTLSATCSSWVFIYIFIFSSVVFQKPKIHSGSPGHSSVAGRSSRCLPACIDCLLFHSLFNLISALLKIITNDSNKITVIHLQAGVKEVFLFPPTKGRGRKLAASVRDSGSRIGRNIFV